MEQLYLSDMRIMLRLFSYLVHPFCYCKYGNSLHSILCFEETFNKAAVEATNYEEDLDWDEFPDDEFVPDIDDLRDFMEETGETDPTKIPGYTEENFSGFKECGLYQAVKWKETDVIAGMEGPIRIRVNFEGIRSEDVKLFAIYITKKNN